MLYNYFEKAELLPEFISLAKTVKQWTWDKHPFVDIQRFGVAKFPTHYDGDMPGDPFITSGIADKDDLVLNGITEIADITATFYNQGEVAHKKNKTLLLPNQKAALLFSNSGTLTLDLPIDNRYPAVLCSYHYDAATGIVMEDRLPQRSLAELTGVNYGWAMNATGTIETLVPGYGLSNIELIPGYYMFVGGVHIYRLQQFPINNIACNPYNGLYYSSTEITSVIGAQCQYLFTYTPKNVLDKSIVAMHPNGILQNGYLAVKEV